MLLQITQLTEDDSYEFGDGTEPSEAWINIHLVESVTDDEEDKDKGKKAKYDNPSKSTFWDGY